MYNINRRKFLGLFGCTCCSIILPSCSTVPITERKQLSIIPEATINRQAAQAYENFKSKTKLIENGKEIDQINKVTSDLKSAIKNYYKSKGRKDPTSNFAWEVVLVDNKEVKNAVSYTHLTLPTILLV